MTLQLVIRCRFRQSCCYLDEHPVLQGMRNLVTCKRDMWVTMQLPAAHMGVVNCQLMPSVWSHQLASTCPGLSAGTSQSGWQMA